MSFDENHEKKCRELERGNVSFMQTFLMFPKRASYALYAAFIVFIW